MASIHSVRLPLRTVAALALAASSLLLQGNISRMESLEARLLEAHNDERVAAGIPPLHWDATLADNAAAWGEHLAEINDLQHARSGRSDPDPQGENLWLGTRGYYSPEDMVGMWVDEKKYYRPGIFPANSRTGSFEDVGHYTQLMWRSTDRVGCAITHNQKYDFLVCRYLEGGNVIGERPF